MGRITLIIIAILICGVFEASAQDTRFDELERRVRELESKLTAAQAAAPSPELEEIRRQIEILTREIESLKVERQQTPEADAQQYGMGAAASKVYRVEQGVSLGGYGEMLYENYSATRDDRARSGRKDQLDFLRAILYAGYKFNDRFVFNSELEFEHGTTNSNIGEVSVEFAYIDFFIRPWVNARAGLLLVPMGIVNELHEPTAFLGARRPQVEQQIIPSTWRENGAGIFGDIGPVSYRAYIVNGFDAEDFTSAGWRAGRQQGARAKAEDFAGVLRIDVPLVEGTMFGASVYSGDSAQDKVAPGFGEFDANITLYEAHVDSQFRGVRARALWTEGRLGDARLVNLANNLTGDRSVGDRVGGWYGELGYDLGAVFNFGDHSVIPYARYERFSTQKSVPAGYLLDPQRDQTITTWGVAWLPHPQVIIKTDFQDVDNKASTGVDQINVLLGYIF